MMWLVRVLIPAALSSVSYFAFPFERWWQLSLGLVLGAWLVVVDQYLSRWYRPGLSAGAAVESRAAAVSNTVSKQLLSHSILFVVVMIAVSIYDVLSGSSIIGKGMLLSWHAVTAWQWWMWLSHPEKWRAEVWWQVVWQPSDDQVTYMVWSYTGFVMVLLGLLALNLR